MALPSYPFLEVTMDPGDCLARIAETQIGTRADLPSGRAALYGYLLATDAPLNAFQPEWSRQGFGTGAASRYHLLDQRLSGPQQGSGSPNGGPSEQQWQAAILRIHSWCAAFVDWCMLQLLQQSPDTTSLVLSHRPKTASAFGLLHWAKTSHCTVFDGSSGTPQRGDIAVFNFSHTGIVAETAHNGFYSVEGNTTIGAGGNQGYLVARRWRPQSALKGFVRLPPKHRLGDYNISPAVSHTA